MTICPSCGDHAEDNYVAVRHAVCKSCMDAVISKRVPPEFLRTDPGRIGNLCAVLSMAPLRRGVVIFGASGAGKTRAMWELLKRVMTVSTEVFCPGKNSFDHRLAAQYRNESAEEWIAGICDTDIVAFDDITKMRMTERVESELFGIIDHRVNHHLPIIVTVQGDSTSISKAIGEEKSAPIIRRLREFCDPVSVHQVTTVCDPSQRPTQPS